MCSLKSGLQTGQSTSPASALESCTEPGALEAICQSRDGQWMVVDGGGGATSKVG